MNTACEEAFSPKNLLIQALTREKNARKNGRNMPTSDSKRTTFDSSLSASVPKKAAGFLTSPKAGCSFIKEDLPAANGITGAVPTLKRGSAGHYRRLPPLYK